MAVSKVTLINNGVQETLIDVSNDTVTQNDVAQGVTFHDAQGNQQVGTATGGANLGTKSINANGTYQASSDGLDGFSEVSVNVTTSDALSKSLIEGTLTSIGPSELSNVSSIGSFAFGFKPNLQSVQIPDTITQLNGYTFTECASLSSMTLPSTLTTLGEGEFSGCTSLTTLTYNDATESSPCLPSTLTSIGNSCFQDCGLSGTLTVPGSVTELFGNTFYGTNLTNIIFGEGLQTLGEDEFSGSNSLQYLTIPSTFTGFSTRTGYSLTQNSSINTVTFNNTLINMVNTGWLCPPNSGSPGSAHNIVCTDYTLPYGGQNNVTITYNNGSTSTFSNGHNADYYNPTGGTGNITSASFSNDLTVICILSAGIFINYGSTFSITLPSSLKVIQNIDDASQSNEGTYITSLTIPSSVVYLGDPALALFGTPNGFLGPNNAHITTLILESTTPPYLGTGSLGTLSALTSIKVPQGSLSTYQNDSQWSQYSNIISEV